MRRVALLMGLILGVGLWAGIATDDAAAHRPPTPRQYETRILTDQNDDCGEHGSDGCQGTFDLLALNVREAYDAPNSTHVFVWALWMDSGASGGEHAATVYYAVEDEERSFTVTGTVEDGFQSEAAAWIRGPYPLLLGGQPDGERFGIDVAVPRDDLTEGDVIRAFRMEASRDGTVGDVMPGTYYREDGTLAPRGEAEQAEPAETRAPSYTLRGPTHYLDVRIDDPARAAIMIQSGLSRTDQIVTVEVDPPSVGIREHDMEHTATFDVPGGGFHGLSFAPTDGARTAHIVVTTDLGGYSTLDLDFEDAGTDGGDATAPPALFAAFAVLAAAVAGRRKRP